MNDESYIRSDEPFKSGDLIAGGKYEILSLVGTGGMGQVFRARHTLLDRTVAIKVLHPEFTADPKVEARFEREAQATSRLNHRNAMQVLDFGAEQKNDDTRFLYIVMEFLEGRELTELIASQAPLETDRVALIGSQVCAALFQAHEQGIIHRDLKPENIMILPHEDDDGHMVERVKVCDFGIAKLQSSGEYDTPSGKSLTEVGEVFGTPLYMSPEQARGKRLDPRSDIYALGVVLFRMATGQLPFIGENFMGILAQHMTDAPPRPSDIHSGVDPNLEAIILKCLEKEPEHRFQSVRDLRGALQGLLGGRFSPSPSFVDGYAGTVHAVDRAAETAPLELASTTPSSLSSQITGQKQTKRGRWTLVAVALVALMATAALAYNYYLKPTSSEPTRKNRIARQVKTPAVAYVKPEPQAPQPVVTEPTAPQEPVAPTAATEARDEETTVQEEPTKKRRKKRRRPRSTEEEDPENTDAPPVVETPPPPVETPIVIPPVTPKPPQKPEPPKPLVIGAKISFTVTDVRGSLSTNPVRQAMQRATDSYRDCYNLAAKKAGRNWAGTQKVQFTINVDGRAKKARVTGGGLPGLDSCVQSAISKLRSNPRPDTGTVEVEAKISYKATQ